MRLFVIVLVILACFTQVKANLLDQIARALGIPISCFSPFGCDIDEEKTKEWTEAYESGDVFTFSFQDADTLKSYDAIRFRPGQFYDTPRNRDRFGLTNETIMAEVGTYKARPYKAVIKERFETICNAENLVCCKKTLPHQETCSTLPATKCHSFRSAKYPGRSRVFACPVCKRLSFVDTDGSSSQMRITSTEFDWDTCFLNKPFVYECSVFVVEPNEFIAGDFGDVAISFRDRPMRVEFGNPTTEAMVNKCESQLVDYEAEIHSEEADSEETE